MTASAWLVEGASCVIVEREWFGPGYARAERGIIGKVGKIHFTVDGVTVKFRVAIGALEGHEQAGEGRMMILPDDSPFAAHALAAHTRKTAEVAVEAAYQRWNKTRQRQGGDAAMYALADAVNALRAICDTGADAPHSPKESS